MKIVLNWRESIPYLNPDEQNQHEEEYLNASGKTWEWGERVTPRGSVRYRVVEGQPWNWNYLGGVSTDPVLVAMCEKYGWGEVVDIPAGKLYRIDDRSTEYGEDYVLEYPEDIVWETAT